MTALAEKPVYYERPTLTEDQLSRFQKLYSAPLENEEERAARTMELRGLALEFTQEQGFSSRQAITLMREASIDLLPEGDSRRAKYEVAAYAGCQHTQLLKDFDWIKNHRPDVLYVSDLAGSDFVVKTQAIFYNKIFNHVRNYIGKDKLHSLQPGEIQDMVIASHSEILALVVDEKSGETVWGGYRELYYYIQELFPGDSSMPYPGDSDAVVNWIAGFTPPKQNHGYWMASLSKGTRERILDDIGTKTRAIVEKLKLLRDGGTQVIMIAGNWDDPDTLDLIANEGKGEESGEITGYFQTIEYVREQGFPVYTDLGIIETETTMTILAPFRWMLNRFDLDDRHYQEAKEKAAWARQEGKLVVLYPHSALQLTDSKANRDVAQRTLQMMADFYVDEVAHGHDHRQPEDRRKDHYPVYVYPGSVPAVRMTDRSTLDALGTIPMGVVVYMPIGESALAVRRKGRRQRMGSNPLPAELL